MKAATSAPDDVGALPPDVTSFVGRRREIAEAKRLLSGSRLLTLTGPGGVGKTRLAIRIADTVRRAFHDGVRFIEFAELRDPALLAETAEENLGLRQSPRPALDTVVDYLRPRELLLVLDNCEHLIEDCALFVAALIRSCPRLRILVTSRQSLGVYGETVLVVPPLPVPDPEQVLSPDALMQYDSVRMFVDRASAVLPKFDLHSQNCATLARLCHRLDGIPLAIELAAVWLRALSLDQIDQRLSRRYRLLTGGPRCAPSRQRTLRALIDWSHDLCSEPEQRFWSRLSVFSGSFDLAAVEHVGGDDEVVPEEISDVVRSLVDKSILLREEHDGNVRYRMLETMREYGQERLVASGEYTAVRRRHRDWCAAMVERFEVEWFGPDQEAWIGRLRREHSNLRVALDFCVTQPGEAVEGLRMATRLDDYWGIRGFHTEVRHWLAQMLMAAPEPTRERASALRMSGWFALLQGDIDAGVALLAEATGLAERLGDPAEIAYVTLIQGMATLFSGDTETAALLFDGALSLFQTVHDPRCETWAAFIFGLTLGLKGERERGLALLDACLDWTARRGEVFWRSYALWGVCHIEVLHGSLERAEETGKQALGINGRIGSKLGMAFVIDTLAWVAERQGDHTRAATLFGAAASVWHEIGASPDNYATFAAPHHEHIAHARAALGDDRYEAAFRRGRLLSGERATDYALGTSPPVRAKPREEGGETRLTKREEEIAGLVAEGMANKEIAARLVIAPRTAEAHVQHILAKLGFTSRAQVAAWVAARKSAPGGDST
ncbi:ATP-binding protein [Streptomyces sp. KR80]|uniref:ATP-binding protein n=1 Tax=Streptomyces sp. KR80 TaxID=3457426 RepID=UPI003FCFB893